MTRYIIYIIGSFNKCKQLLRAYKTQEKLFFNEIVIFFVEPYIISLHQCINFLHCDNSSYFFFSRVLFGGLILRMDQLTGPKRNLGISFYFYDEYNFIRRCV